MHGKQEYLHIANGAKLFHGLPPDYSSSKIPFPDRDKRSLPDELLVIAEDDEGDIMAVKA